jgi:hypothetical protein
MGKKMTDSAKIIKIWNEDGTVTRIKQKKPDKPRAKPEKSLDIKTDRIYSDKELRQQKYKREARFNVKTKTPQQISQTEQVTRCGQCQLFNPIGCTLGLGRSLNCKAYKGRC